MFTKLIVATVLLSAGFAAGRVSQTPPSHIYELRIYTPADGKLDAVNARFQEIFPKMFRGGRASLRLTNPDDMLETGIDILAQPPGKKLASIELMSGGEKALTAVSLIFAIFQIKPSPFCILDEVDAPLDEANVARYNELVRSMTDRSQFILITHIKRTMQSVDVLYGVTMQEPGVSKLVSVRFDTPESRAGEANGNGDERANGNGSGNGNADAGADAGAGQPELAGARAEAGDAS